MNPLLGLRSFLFMVACAFVIPLPAAEPVPAESKAAAPTKPATFLIILRLDPKYHDQKAWTDADNATVRAHFLRLQEAAARNQVVLAGRTSEPLDQTMGLVIFHAADEAAAREFMDQDPCVMAGIMTATLHPYSIAVQRKS